MQFQVQEMVSKDLKKQDKGQREADTLDLYVGLKTGLEDPFNMFLKLSDITSQKELIYFYAYSMGKKKVVLWGVYNVNTNEFLIDDACRYSPNDLKFMLNNWKEHDYSFYFSSVRNRITSRMDQELLFDNRKTILEIFNNFKNYFLVKLAREGLMNPNNLSLPLKKLYSNDEFEFNYSKILTEVRKILNNKYKDINEYVFEALFDEIENKQEETIIRNALQTGIDISRLNSSLKNVVTHLSINIFICVFADMEEYRTAKYILYLNDNKQGEKIRSMLKGQFLYEWIIELARILEISNIKSFMNKYALEMVKLVEKKINQSDVGVIGDSNRVKTPLVENIAYFFENFISQSPYSKISYTNDLPSCPNPELCLDGENNCGVYSHGYKTTSKYDLT